MGGSPGTRYPVNHSATSTRPARPSPPGPASPSAHAAPGHSTAPLSAHICSLGPKTLQVRAMGQPRILDREPSQARTRDRPLPNAESCGPPAGALRGRVRATETVQLASLLTRILDRLQARLAAAGVWLRQKTSSMRYASRPWRRGRLPRLPASRSSCHGSRSRPQVHWVLSRAVVVCASQPIGLATARLVMAPSLRVAPVCLPVSLASSGHLTS